MASPHQDTARLPLPPPLLPAAALALAAAGEWLLPIRLQSGIDTYGWAFWLGMLVVAVGLGAGVWAEVAFHRAGTSANPYTPTRTIVMAGPYGLTRNPIYWAFLLIVAGLSLMLSLEWGIVLLPALWFALDRLIVRREEAYLAAKFGDEYDSYRRQTRRWL